MERKRDSHALCKEAVTCWKQERAAERVRNPRVCRESMPNPRVRRESMPRLWLTPGRNTYERRKDYMMEDLRATLQFPALSLW